MLGQTTGMVVAVVGIVVVVVVAGTADIGYQAVVVAGIVVAVVVVAGIGSWEFVG